MKQRGRKGAASLSVISAQGVEATARPDPSPDLTEEQADEWKAIVNCLPADWFKRENISLLAQYCRHVIASRHVGQLVTEMETDEGDKFSLESYDKILKMQEREGRAISSLATRMRLTQQSRWTAEGTGTKDRNRTTSSKPWQKR